jgi:hypothetical protein
MIDTEIILTVLFIFFTLLAFLIRDAFIFGIASFVSIIFGIDLVILFTADPTAAWGYGILGFGLFLFGLWMLIAAYEYSIKEGKGK